MVQLSYRRHRFLAEIIQHAIWLYLRFTLSYRDVEELLAERGLDVSYENGAALGAEIRPADRAQAAAGLPTPKRAMAPRRCVTNTLLKEEVWCCTRDEGRPCESAAKRDPAPAPVTTLIRRRESAEHGVPIGADRDPTKTLSIGIEST
jgi:hypothetical protein